MSHVVFVLPPVGKHVQEIGHEGRVRVVSDLVIPRFDKGKYSQGRQWQVMVPHFLSDARCIVFIDVTCGVKMASLTHP